MTAAHLVRPAGKQPKAKARSAPAQPATVYPPGFFTEPVRAWKQLQFVSAMAVDKWGHLALLARAERERQASTGQGWSGGTMALPGTPVRGRPRVLGR